MTSTDTAAPAADIKEPGEDHEFVTVSIACSWSELRPHVVGTAAATDDPMCVKRTVVAVYPGETPLYQFKYDILSSLDAQNRISPTKIRLWCKCNSPLYGCPTMRTMPMTTTTISDVTVYPGTFLCQVDAIPTLRRKPLSWFLGSCEQTTAILEFVAERKDNLGVWNWTGDYDRDDDLK